MTVLDALKAYNSKRDFKTTAEPSGRPGKAIKPGGNIFMVQKHAATRLHYDFRLELDGVLKSWAVTRGPSLDPDDKRLAVMTEDHPLDYATFEGTIPKGAYGGGTVMLWDRGTWEPEGDPRVGLKKGKLHFTLRGERMKGEWVLFRLKGKPGEARENWLLRKVEDDHAGEASGLVDAHVTSVSTGRGMADIAAAGSGRSTPKKAKAVTIRSAPLPAFRPVQLATLVDTPPTGDAWVHEVKYDGYRALLAVGGGTAKAYTRNANDWTEQFGQIADAAAKLKVGSALIDGEVVALDAQGMPSFSTLQNALKARKPLIFFAFDLLEIDGTDLTHLPLTERKARLKPLIEAGGDPLFYADHVRGRGEDVLSALCAKNYEGIVSKRADGKYSGKRTGSWLKIKCIKRQEFVIGGWKVSDKRHGFSSLLLGYYEGDAFKYAGRVGTGFNGDSLEDIARRLEPLAIPKPAYDTVPTDARRGARWVEPELVAEIAYAEITPDGILRHPSFLGLRFDKPARDVVREIEAPAPAPAAKPKALPRLDNDSPRAGIKITNPDRPVFPDVGISKMALVDYYMLLAEPLMEHMANRPLSLVRCPQGRGKYCFFQKHDSGAFHESVKHVPIAEADGNREPYLYVDDIQGVIACLQMGTLEFHGWGSHIATVEQPDRIVFDLDPDPTVAFKTVLDAAFDIRDRLAALGLETWPMLSGGKGVHVILPIRPEIEWPEIKAFTRTFAQQLATERPGDFTAALSKAKREGRIFLDYLRNQRGATAILPYSTRSREGAPVAAPVTWKELRDFESGHHFSVADGPELLKRARRLDAAGWARSDQSLLAALKTAD